MKHLRKCDRLNGRKVTVHSTLAFQESKSPWRTFGTKRSIIEHAPFVKSSMQCFESTDSVTTHGCLIDSFVPAGTQLQSDP
jgi:hypothetical protein